jgi:hypothetical protein
MMKFNKKKLTSIIAIVTLLLVVIIIPIKSGITAVNHHTDWLKKAKWGVFTHYLADSNLSASDWNNHVNSFDVEHLAQQLKSVGAKYYFITLGQNSGHYCSPNTHYDHYVGIRPSKCSSRDLVSDLYKVLNPRGIKLLVYLPSAAPALDRIATSKLKWTSGANRNKEFQIFWEDIIKEWSLRWGNKVEGWWFDGAYWPKEMYNSVLPPNFKSFAAAARIGNSKSIIAFNPGVIYPIITQTEHEDYTAGEMNEPWGVECEGQWVGKAQLHILSYLGSNWGKGPPRYSDNKVAQITNDINRCGGVITWDVPIQSNGHIDQAFVSQLSKINQNLRLQPKFKEIKSPIPPGNLASHKKSKMLDLSEKKLLSVNSAKYFSQLGVDGDSKTIAMPGNEWAWTYQVDLEKLHLISKIKVTFGKTFATEYTVSVSSDKSKWSEITHEKNSNGGKHSYIFEPVASRYVKVKGIKPDGENQKGIQMSIAELEVYQ